MLICSVCKEPWEEVGFSSSRMRGDNYSVTDYKCECGSRRKPIEQDDEIVYENVRLAKKAQRLQDVQRVERKSFRENARVENAVEEYASKMYDILKSHGDKLCDIHTPAEIEVSDDEHEVGIVHVTDTHFNELISLPHNKYDISVASQRLYKLAKEAKNMFVSRGIKKVLVAFTGDLMNSDRRLDELLNQATNRSKATFVAVDLVKKFLLDLASVFEVSVASVLGNESRVNKDMSFANNVISDNYDFTIINMVRLLVEDTGIKFSELDKMELFVKVNGKTIALIHDVGKITNSQHSTQSALGRYSLSGVNVDLVMGGHLHAERVEAYSVRSGSLAGSNEYNENALNLFGKAVQTLVIVGKNHTHIVAVDVQNTNNEEWYDIDSTLMEYNCKSHSKTKHVTSIMEIVI